MHTLYTAMKNSVHLILVHKHAYENVLTTKISRTTVCNIFIMAVQFDSLVCCCFVSRAEVHGEQMLSNISKFLLNKESNPLPVAMVIDGLVALCRADVTDVATLWGVLSKPRHSHMKLVDDNRSVVSIASF